MSISQTRSVNEHLELEIAKHPERSYVTKMENAQPQFSPEQLITEVQTETAYWMAILSNASDPSTFLETFSGLDDVFDGLKYEANGLKDLRRAIQAHSVGRWSEASNYYSAALSDIHFSLSQWQSAISDIADDSLFDPYCPTAETRKKHHMEEPVRSSYQNMAQISPLLFRIYQNIDRLFCVSQEINQRRIACLTVYMQEAEEQEAARRARGDINPEED